MRAKRCPALKRYLEEYDVLKGIRIASKVVESNLSFFAINICKTKQLRGIEEKLKIFVRRDPLLDPRGLSRLSEMLLM